MRVKPFPGVSGGGVSFQKKLHKIPFQSEPLRGGIRSRSQRFGCAHPEALRVTADLPTRFFSLLLLKCWPLPRCAQLAAHAPHGELQPGDRELQPGEPTPPNWPACAPPSGHGRTLKITITRCGPLSPDARHLPAGSGPGVFCLFVHLSTSVTSCGPVWFRTHGSFLSGSGLVVLLCVCLREHLGDLMRSRTVP